MEFKISEQSRKNLEQLAKNVGAYEYMNEVDRKEFEKEKERKNQEKIQKRIQKKIQKGFFKTSDDLISYVLDKGKIIYNDNFLGSPDYMYRSPKNKNIVIHYCLQYNDVDCPIGLGETHKTIDEFIEWAKSIGEEDRKEDGFLPCWHKREYD
jgi:hypothetical protein